MYLLFTLLTYADPFESIRHGLARLLMAVLGLVAMVSLTLVIIHILQGDKEGAKKAAVWCIVTAVGFSLIAILGSLSI